MSQGSVHSRRTRSLFPQATCSCARATSRGTRSLEHTPTSRLVVLLWMSLQTRPDIGLLHELEGLLHQMNVVHAFAFIMLLSILDGHCTLLYSMSLSRIVSGIVAWTQVGHPEVIRSIKSSPFTLEPTWLHGSLRGNLLLPCQALKQKLIASVLTKGLTAYMHEIARMIMLQFALLYADHDMQCCLWPFLRVPDRQIRLAILAMSLPPVVWTCCAEFIEFQLQTDNPLLHPHTRRQGTIASDVKGSQAYTTTLDTMGLDSTKLPGKTNPDYQHVTRQVDHQ